jgi:hypothetical protein
MPLKLNSSGGGSVTLDTPSTASTFTLTVPAITGTAVVTGSSATVSQGMLAAGVAGNGPAFYATKNGAQSVSSNTQTKLTVPNEQFDTASCYDTSTSRFTPNVAGYYQINYAVYGGGTTNTQAIISALYKNGAIYGTISTSGTYLYSPSYPYSDGSSTGSALVYMNGSTDYLELYGLLIGTGTLNITQARFDGSLVRTA